MAALLGCARPTVAPVKQIVKESKALFSTDCARPIRAYAFDANGKKAVAYWKDADLLTQTYAGTVSFQFARLRAPLLLCDPMSGNVYPLGPEHVRANENGDGECANLPLTDCPLILMEDGFAEIEP